MQSIRPFAIAILFTLSTYIGLAQQLRLGKNPYTVEKSAVLELQSDNQGLLLSRITDTTSINFMSPPDGMMIYFTPAKRVLIRANGYWQTLPTVIDTSSIANFYQKTRSLFSGTSPVTFNNGTGQIGITQATTSTNGYLSSTDWNTFNNKAAAFTTGNLTETGSGILTITGGTGAVVGSGTAIQVRQANTSQNGFLSSTDWNTFNNKLSTIDTTNISNFYIKSRSLLNAGTGITYNAATGTISSSVSTANSWAYNGNTVGSIKKIGTIDNYDFPFITNNTERMRLSNAGNLAIGATSFDATYPEKLLVNAGVTSSVNAIAGKGSINSYLQLNIQNQSTGTSASSDVVATADNGNETSNYVDMGINSSTNTSGSMGAANDAYLYNIGQNMLIGTGSASKSLVFMTGGTAQSINERMRIDGSGNIGIGTTSPSTRLHVMGTNPLTLSGVQLGTNTSSDSLLTITNGLVRKLPASAFASSFSTGNLTETGSGILTITGGTGAVAGSGTAIQVKQANTSQNGFLSSTDWNTFNNKLSTIDTTNISNFYIKSRSLLSAGSGIGYNSSTGVISNTGVLSVNGNTGALTMDTGYIANFSVKTKNLFSGTAPVTFNNATGAIGITQATTSTNGYLSSTDWNTFNNKAAAFTTGNLTETGSGILTITGGTGAVAGSGTAIQVKQANTSQNGFLSSTDWNTFNNKLSTIDTTNISNFYIKSRSLLSAGSGIGYNSSTGVISNTGVISVNGNTGALTMDTGYIANFSVKTKNLFSGTAPVTFNNATGAIGITQATTSTNGYLTSTDWNTFNNKLSSIDTTNIANFYIKSRSLLNAGTGITYNAATGTISSSVSTANSWAYNGNTVGSIKNIGTIDNYDFPFITNNTERMRLSNAGNLAIGATSFDATYPEKLLVNAGVTSSVNAIAGKGSINSYLQLNIQNQSTGTSASSDVVATADNGNETSNYVDMGINSSTNTSGSMGAANDAYLYNIGQNMLIGTGSASKSLVFMTGGTAQSINERMRIDGSGNIGIGTTSPSTRLHVMGTNPLTLSGVQLGTNTSSDSLLTITNGLVRKLPASAFASSFSTGNLTETGSGILTITGGTGAVAGSGTAIQVKQANTSQNGFLSSTDWNTFNNKLSTIDTTNIANFYLKVRGEHTAGAGIGYSNTSGVISNTGVLSVNGNTGALTMDTGYIANFSVKTKNLFSGTAPVTFNNATGAIGITQATTSTNGYLTSTDWNTFNNKAAAFTTGNLTETGSGILTITGGTGAVAGSGTAIQVKQANTSQNGFLSSTDWNTFNNKLSTIDTTNIANFYLKVRGEHTAGAGIGYSNTSGVISNTGVLSVNGNTGALTMDTGYIANFSVKTKNLFSGTAPVTFNNATGAIGITQATTSTNGYLSSTDWNTFNNKAAAFTTGNLTETGSGILTITGGTGAVAGSGTAIQVKQANTSQNGFLSSTDWNTFNNKLSTIDTTNISNFYIKSRSLLNAGTGITYNAATGTISSSVSTANSWAYNGNTVGSIKNIGTIDNYDFPFITNNTERMRLSNAGNLAIGATSFDATYPEKLLVNAGVTSSVNAIAGKGSINSYLQLNIQNQSTGTSASSDVVATADNGNETSNYVDMGINSSTNTSGSMGAANDAYLYNIGQNMLIGTGSASKSLVFMTGGTAQSINERMRIDGLGRVGIGVTNSTNPLTVKDTLEIRRTGSMSSLLFSNTAGSGDFRIGGDGGDIFWQGGGGRNLQMGAYWGIQLAGDRQNATIPGFSSGVANTGVLVQAQRDASVPLGIQANSATQTANLTEWRSSAGTILSVADEYGNFGIGTSNPLAKLHVEATNPLSLFGVQTGTNTSADSVLTISSGVVKKLPASTFSASSNSWLFGGNTVSSIKNFGTIDNNHLPFITNNTERMRISSTGNLGIGTSTFNAINPEKLVVDAGTTTSVNAIVGKGSINSYLQLNIQNQSAGNSASSDVVATADNGDETTNFVDMGINSSTNNAGVMGGINDSYLYNIGQNFLIGTGSASKSLVFMTGGTTQSSNERMRIDGTGKVGIGTNAPTTDLTLFQGSGGASSARGFRFAGNSIGGTSSGTGFGIALGYNVSGNKQLWMGDADYFGTNTGAFVRFTSSSGVPTLDAVLGDNTSRRPISIGIGGDPQAAVILGSDASMTAPGSFIWGNGNMAIGGSYRANGAPANGLIVQGNTGIGTASPTAALHLRAGNATASTGAPLKFTSGTVLSTPEDGAVEYDGTNYSASVSTTRYTLAKTLTATAALDFPNTGGLSSSVLTIAVTGAVDGDVVSVGVPNAIASTAGVCYTAYVSAANTVSVKFNNYTAGSVNPASATFRVSVIKY